MYVRLTFLSAFDKLLLAFKQQDLEDVKKLPKEDTRRILISSLGETVILKSTLGETGGYSYHLRNLDKEHLIYCMLYATF